MWHKYDYALLLRENEFAYKNLVCINENIDNYGYIGILILRIYWIYRRYIDRYFGKKNLGSLKLLKTYENNEKNSKNNIINNNRHFKIVL